MTPEGKVRQYLKKQAKALGLEHRKLGWIGRRNAPDEFVFNPKPANIWVGCGDDGDYWDAPICAFIECKAEGEVPNGGQEREIARLRNAGFAVYVVDDELSVDLALSTLVNP